jgi:hypothetical protein
LQTISTTLLVISTFLYTIRPDGEQEDLHNQFFPFFTAKTRVFFRELFAVPVENKG